MRNSPVRPCLNMPAPHNLDWVKDGAEALDFYSAREPMKAGFTSPRP